MKRIFSRFFAVIISATFIFAASSCKGKNNTDPEQGIYNAESYELPNSLDIASKIFPVGKNIAVLGLKDNNGVSDIKLEIFDEFGTVKCENTIYSVDSTSENYRTFEFMRCSQDGNIISAEIEFTNEGKNLFYIVKYDPESGEKLSETDLKDVPEIFAENYEGIFCSSNGNTFIYSKNILAVFDVNGNLLYNIEYPSNPMEPSLINAVYETSDGRIFAEINSLINNNDKHSKETELILIDIENMTFGKKYPASSGDDFISGNYGFDLIYLNKNGIYGYDIDSGKSEIIIDLIRSGIDVQTFGDHIKIALLPDKKAACISENDEQQKFIILTQADNSNAAKKEKITLYALYLDNNVKKQALEFNKNNNKYEIELVDYAPDTEDRHGAASERLNLDLAAGKIPDIIEFDTGFYVEQTFPKESYMSKGMFADLYGFIDNDPEFNKDDFLPNIFKLFEFNGKLYEAVPFFNISTLVGKASIVGEKAGWTLEEFLDFAEQHKGEIIFNAADGDKILSMLMKNNCEIFVNFETGECNFDSEEFVRLLEICAAHPADKFAEIAYSNTKFKNGNVLLSPSLITGFGTGWNKISFGEDFTYKGYPGNGSGSYAYPAMSLAITSNAKYPEGAWEFVKSFFTKEYQDDHAEHYPYSFSVRISSLDISMELAKQDYYIDEDGEKIENSWETVLDDGTTVTVPKNTDDDNEKIRSLIYSVGSGGRSNSEINKIIGEEAGAFFAGQKSAEETAEIIQNRVSNYLAENG